MLTLTALVIAASTSVPRTDSVYILSPKEGVWLEAESCVSGSAKVVGQDPGSFGTEHVQPPEGKRVTLLVVPLNVAEPQFVWARVRGRGIALKCSGQKDRWRWPKCEAWRWVSFGAIPGEQLSPKCSFMGDTAIDAVVVTSDASWQPTEIPNSVAALRVDFSKKTTPVPRYLASANINSPKAMLIDRDDWHDAVRGLGIRMMRFQAPAGKLDYRERKRWNDETFAVLDGAVAAARERWGVEKLMFGMHRMALPLRDGKLIEAEFPAYADALTKLVRRYASPGHVLVDYWEPFNELDHAGFLKKLAAHGQGFSHVAKLYAVCSQAMKAVNPGIKVGGPAAMWPGGWETKMMLETPGAVADFVSWHQYPTGKASTPDESVLGAVHREKGLVDGLRRMQNAVREAGVKHPLEFLMTEFHINYSLWNPPDRRAATAFTAVFAASVLVNLGQRGVDAAMIHDVRARHYGLVGPASGDPWSRQMDRVARDTTDDPIHVRPVGWVYRWFNEYVRGHWAVCEWHSTPPGWAESPRSPVLEAAAVAGNDRNAVVLINRDTTAHSVVLTGLRDSTRAGGPYDRPVTTAVVDDQGARIQRATAPSLSGRWPCAVPPMGVVFIVFP